MLDFSKANEWKIIETDFDPTALGKVEANFCLGNGYLGLRSATEEKYLGETRDLLVAGTFNRFSPEEVTELPNAADVTNIELTLNGARFGLTQGTIQEYSRELNIQTGLLTRRVIWTSPKGDEFVLTFERLVSLKRLHTIAARVSITPEKDAAITFQSGIDGRVTCDGSQHFTEGETRFYDKKYLQFTPKTIQSGITFVIDATHRFYVDGEAVEPKSDINILRRRMFSKFALEVKAGQTVVLEKFSNVYTSRDKELEGYTYHQMQTYALKALQEDEAAGFDALLAESAAYWKEKVWDRVPITIDGPEFDQLAIRFAQYHMQLMTPAHDNRMNIGAKGLSGEGYKGHTFWDTEIFLLPYFIFNMPEVARSLEEYRYDDDSRYIRYADIHSHNSMDPFFSLEDNWDERGTGLYFVMGHLERFFPELKARISCEGSFVEIDPAEVIDWPASGFPDEWSRNVVCEKKAVGRRPSQRILEVSMLP